LVFGNTLRASKFLQALRVSIAETPSTFTISPKGLPDGWGDLEGVRTLNLYKSVLFLLIIIKKFSDFKNIVPPLKNHPPRYIFRILMTNRYRETIDNVFL